MSFYVINPSHPHLGAAINLRLFPLAAAEEVDFSEIAEAYLFYGDGLWQQGHRLFRREGIFAFKIPHFTGGRLVVRFFLEDSAGESKFATGEEHPIAFGQYAELFEQTDSRQVEVGALITALSLEEVVLLPDKISRFLRNGTERLWMRLGSEILVRQEYQDRLADVLQNVQSLPNTYVELTCPPQTTAGAVADSLSSAGLLNKRWVKAFFLSAQTGLEGVKLAAEVADITYGKQTLARVKPRDYLDSRVSSNPLAVPIGSSSSSIDAALARGLGAAAGELIWMIREADESPERARFTQEFAAATGVGHLFCTSYTPAGPLALARPPHPDIAILCPREWISNSQSEPRYPLNQLVESLEETGFLVSISPQGHTWQARAAVCLEYNGDWPDPADPINRRCRILALATEEVIRELPEETPPTWSVQELPESVKDLQSVIKEWFGEKIEDKGSWIVIPGDGQKR